MDSSFDLPSEPRLSNSMLKNRPIHSGRTQIRPKRKVNPLIVLNDAVPLDSKIFLNDN